MKSGVIFTIVGVVLMVVGCVLLKTVADPHGIMIVFPYVCLGLGCGSFGHGIGNVVNERTMKNHPELKKQAEIESKDERNQAVSNRAKGKAFDLMLLLFGALMIIFVLMQADMTIILMMVVAYLIITGVFICYLVKYQK
ncbi:MAG: hypothetical protein IKV45_00340 [Firmicutes bacterium]|nr:hypothetical protein [Bacillota bacterium]